jgi:hypothetical protein
MILTPFIEEEKQKHSRIPLLKVRPVAAWSQAGKKIGAEIARKIQNILQKAGAIS